MELLILLLAGLGAVACFAVLLLGPAVAASLLARWMSSPSSDERRHGFPVVPVGRHPPASPSGEGRIDVAEREDAEVTP